MDIIGSALVLVVLSPVFLVIALAIKLSSKGPVFYSQQRVGPIRQAIHFSKIQVDACRQ